MASPKDYVTEAKKLNEQVGSKVPMLIAAIIAGVIAAIPTTVIRMVLGLLAPLGAAIGAAVTTLLMVALVKMAMKIRSGQAVQFAEVLNVQSFLVPGLILGAPAAAINLLAYLGLVVSILGTIFSLVAALVSIVLLWAPYEMATKNAGFMESWMASVNFWKKDPVNVLLFIILGAIFSLIQGILIFTPGIALVAFLLYYQDKTGQQPFTASAAAPAMAGAPS